MKLSNAIADTLRTVRMNKNLSLRDVSAKSHVSLGHISGIETGKKSVSNQTLEALAKGMDISLAELLREIYKYLEEQEKLN